MSREYSGYLRMAEIMEAASGAASTSRQSLDASQEIGRSGLFQFLLPDSELVLASVIVRASTVLEIW
jgi:hypothetical protein